MNRFWMIAAGLACSGLVFAAEEALPKAETVLDRYVEVTGGKAAYEKRKSETVTGSMDMPAQGLKGSMTTYSDTTDNVYVVIDLEGIGKIESGVYNGEAWESSAVQGSRLKTGDEKADMIRDTKFNGPIYWRKMYPKVETVGTQDINGDLCYKVVATPAQGKPQTLFFSKKTGLMMKRMATITNPMGEMEIEVDVSEYKDFDGVISPTKMVQKMMGMEFSITIDSVKTNVEIPKDKFEPPAEIKKLMTKPA